MIDKIGYSRPATAATRASIAKRASNVSGTAFSDALSTADSATAAADGIQHTAAVSSASLIGLQEVSEEELQRRKSLKRGRMTIEALEKLRDGLLMGSVPMATLTALERLVKEERAHTLDPMLNAILDDIELRAAVELAKLEMSGQWQST
jgi:hypothetical protein